MTTGKVNRGLLLACLPSASHLQADDFSPMDA